MYIKKPGLTIALAIAAQAAIALPAMAAPASEPCAGGNLTIVRVNTIIPGGSVAGFEKAVADHAKWYATHGYAQDKIVEAPVMDFDPASKTLIKSPDTFMSFHYHSHEVPMEKQDKDWAAYVAEYRTSSNIKSTTVICLSN